MDYLAPWMRGYLAENDLVFEQAAVSRVEGLMEKEFGETLHSLRRFAANRARAMGDAYLEGIQRLRHGTTPTLGKSYLVVLPLLQWEGLQRMQQGVGERRITLAAFAEDLGVSQRRARQLMRSGYQPGDGVSVAEAMEIQKAQINKALNRG